MPSENTRRIAKNTAMLYIRMLLIMAVTLYTSRVVLNVLGVEDFGIYNVVGGIVVMFSFLNGAMSLSTQRFLAFEIGRKDSERLQKVFSLSVTIHIGIALIILLLAETVGLWFLNTQMNIPEARMLAARWIYQFSIFSFMVSVVQVPYNAAIIAHEQMHVYAYVSIAEVLLKLVIVFILAWISFDKLKLYGMLIFGATVLVMLFYRGYSMRKFGECRTHCIWNRKLTKEMVCFAGWGVLGSLVGVAKNQGVNIILNIFFGTGVNAAYGIANQVNMAVSSFNQNFMTAINPQIIKAYANENRSYLMHLLFRGCKFSFYLVFLISLPILLQTEYILKLWLKTVPIYTSYFVYFILINTLLEAFTYPIGTCIQATGKIKWYQIFVSGTNLLLLPFSYLLFRNGYEPVSSFILLLVITFITLQIRLVYLHKLVRVSIRDFFIQVFGVCLFVTLIGGGVLWAIKLYLKESFGNLVLFTFIGWIWILAVIWVIGFTKEEKAFFVSLWKERIEKRKR